MKEEQKIKFLFRDKKIYTFDDLPKTDKDEHGGSSMHASGIWHFSSKHYNNRLNNVYMMSGIDFMKLDDVKRAERLRNKVTDYNYCNVSYAEEGSHMRKHIWRNKKKATNI